MQQIKVRDLTPGTVIIASIDPTGYVGVGSHFDPTLPTVTVMVEDVDLLPVWQDNPQVATLAHSRGGCAATAADAFVTVA